MDGGKRPRPRAKAAASTISRQRSRHDRRMTKFGWRRRYSRAVWRNSSAAARPGADARRRAIRYLRRPSSPACQEFLQPRAEKFCSRHCSRSQSFRPWASGGPGEPRVQEESIQGLGHAEEVAPASAMAGQEQRRRFRAWHAAPACSRWAARSRMVGSCSSSVGPGRRRPRGNAAAASPRHIRPAAPTGRETSGRAGAWPPRRAARGCGIALGRSRKTHWFPAVQSQPVTLLPQALADHDPHAAISGCWSQRWLAAGPRRRRSSATRTARQQRPQPWQSQRSTTGGIRTGSVMIPL